MSGSPVLQWPKVRILRSIPPSSYCHGFVGGGGGGTLGGLLPSAGVGPGTPGFIGLTGFAGLLDSL